MEVQKIFEKYFNASTSDSSKVNYNTCKECGGKCCKNLACHISPSDLKTISKESIINLIDESGCISIDWWDGDPRKNDKNDNSKTFYLRIRNKDAKVIDAAFGGHPCSLLTDSGCPINFEYRPKGARDLIPVADKECKVLYSKQQCAIDWIPYQDILKEVYLYYKQKGEVTHSIIGDTMEVLRMMLGYEE